METLTLTYMNGNTVYRSLAGYSAGDDVLVLDCTATKDGYTFEGWDTNSSATTVVYEAGQTFQIMGNTVLYAVWKENTPVPTTTTLTVSKIVTGDLTANQLPADFKATVTLQNTTAGTSETYELAKGDLEWTKEISLDAAYSVMVSESNYTLDNYDCNTTGKSAAGVSAMGSGSMWFFTITKGTPNPVCTVENEYTSKVPSIVLPPILKMELQRKDADGNWVTVANSSDDLNVSLEPRETVRYVITVTNPNGVSLGKRYVVNDLDLLLEMDEATCEGILEVDGTSIPLSPETIPADDVYGLQQTWVIDDFGAHGVFTITYEALVNNTVAGVVTNKVSVLDESEMGYQAYSRGEEMNVATSVPSVAISALVVAPVEDSSDDQISDTDVSSDDSGLKV